MPNQPHPSQLSDPSERSNQLDDDRLQEQINQAVDQLTGGQPNPEPDQPQSQPSPESSPSNPPNQGSYFNQKPTPKTDLTQPEHLSAQELQSIREEVTTPAIKQKQTELPDNSRFLRSINPLKIALIAIVLFVIGIGVGLVVVFLL